MFENIDLEEFWDDSEYAIKEYLSEDVTEEVLQSIEKELGYKLPESYIYLMKKHNGGMPKSIVVRVLQEHHGQKTMLLLKGYMA